jgi:hypothetical protein
MELNANLPLNQPHLPPDFTGVFNTIYALFHFHNEKLLKSQSNEPRTQTNGPQASLFLKPQAPANKRRNSIEHLRVLKLTKLDTPIHAWQSIQDEPAKRTPLVVVNGLTIFVDSGPENDVKDDDGDGPFGNCMMQRLRRGEGVDRGNRLVFEHLDVATTLLTP